MREYLSINCFVSDRFDDFPFLGLMIRNYRCVRKYSEICRAFISRLTLIGEELCVESYSIWHFTHGVNAIPIDALLSADSKALCHFSISEDDSDHIAAPSRQAIIATEPHPP